MRRWLSAAWRFVSEFPYRRNVLRPLSPDNCNHGAHQGYGGDFWFDDAGAHCHHCDLFARKPTSVLIPVNA